MYSTRTCSSSSFSSRLLTALIRCRQKYPFKSDKNKNKNNTRFLLFDGRRQPQQRQQQRVFLHHDGIYQRHENQQQNNIQCRYNSNYTLAISRELPNSFQKALSSYYDSSSSSSSDSSKVTNPSIDMTIAKQQHDEYVQRLRKYVPTICLPALEEHPDCIFVEDTVIAIGTTAVITNPGHVTRRGEVDTIKEILLQLGMDVYDMREMNSSAICDGGDVLYTKRHLFVGLSDRTNIQGIDVLSHVFESIIIEQQEEQDQEEQGQSQRMMKKVIPISFSSSHALHLKSIVTHIDSKTLLIPTGTIGDEIIRTMKLTDLGYAHIVRLPTMLTCNVVVVNGTIFAQDEEEVVAVDGEGEEHKQRRLESRRILEQVATERNLNLEWINMSEIAKADGALTCCSVLLQI